MYVYLYQNIQIPQNKYLPFGIHYLSEVNEIWLPGREIIIILGYQDVLTSC